jgi:hypothetical protein
MRWGKTPAFSKGDKGEKNTTERFMHAAIHRFLFAMLTSFLVTTSVVLPAQEVDSIDTSESWQLDDTQGLPDSVQILHRKFDEEGVASLQNDATMKYQVRRTAAESLWDRFKAWLLQLMQYAFEGALTTNWGRVIMWVVGLLLVTGLILMLLKVNAFRIIFGGHQQTASKDLHEDIKTMDFERLIQEAIVQQDYRLGVRLVFLHALRMLSDRDLIQWTPGKTNHDYLHELSNSELKPGFDQLNFYFEYAWYGHFNISARIFGEVQSTFSTWKSRLH